MKTIIEGFKALCLPHYRNEKDSPKATAIQALLDESRWLEGIGIYQGPETPRVVVVSHFDLIPKFRKAFERGDAELKVGKKNIKGGLDNTITNVVAIQLSKMFKNEQVGFLFTDEEETGLYGMRNWMRQMHPKLPHQPFYVNLDVTNEGWGTACSVEYDNPNFALLKSLKELPSAAYTRDRECDDLDMVISHGGCGLSACLPTKGMIHSFDSTARVDTLVPYRESVSAIVKMALLADGFECDVPKWASMKNLLSVESIEELPEKKSPKYTWDDQFFGSAETMADSTPDIEELRLNFFNSILLLECLWDEEGMIDMLQEFDFFSNKETIIEMEDIAPFFRPNGLQIFVQAMCEMDVGAEIEEGFLLFYGE